MVMNPRMMSSLYAVIWILTLASSASMEDWSDPCSILHRVLITERSYRNTTTLSICRDDGNCSKIETGSSSQTVIVSCTRAFAMLMGSVHRRVTEPPIIAFRRVYAPTVSYTISARSRISRRFFNLIEQITKRIHSRFPRLVYVEEHDAPILRALVTMARKISGLVKMSPAIEVNLYREPKIIEWKWSIQMITDYIKLASVSFLETERILISVAPFVHAFLHVAYYLDIASGDELQKCIDFDVLTTIVKYHPLYTQEDEDDGVWYIRFPKRVDLSSTLQTLGPISFVTAPELCDLEEYWGPQVYDLNFPETLFRSLSRYVGNMTVDPETKGWLKQTLITLKLFSEKRMVKVHWIHQIQTDAIDRLASQTLFQKHYEGNQSELLRLMMMLRERLHLTVQLRLLVPLSYMNSYIARAPNVCALMRRPILSFEDKLECISGANKFQLTWQLQLFRTKINSPKPYQMLPIGMGNFYKTLLEDTFDPARGIFLPVVMSADEHRRFVLNRTRDNDEAFASTNRRLRVFVGRLMALTLREEFGAYLMDYLPKKSASDYQQTIMETIFFNSWYIRSGFYDVYHEGMLERIYKNNGTKALMAFQGLNTLFITP